MVPALVRGSRRVLAPLLLVLLAALPAGAQEIRESDLYFSDPANLLRILEEAEQVAAAGAEETALASATRVIETAKEAPSPELAPVLVRALVLRARLRLRMREKAAAIADLEEALGLDPGVGPEARERGPFAVLFRETRSRAVGRLTVESDPPGASVTLEGRPLGRTPVVGAPALAGTRYVKVERPGYAPAEKEVMVGRRPVTVSFVLERRSSTFLLLTDADGAQVSIDGSERGVATRPSPGEADALIAAYNLPIDPEAPPAYFLWRDAAPGTHQVSLAAGCRKPTERTVEIPDGSDATTFLPMERIAGGLRVEGPPDARIRLEGLDPAALPAVFAELCPGTHRLEATAPPARRTRLTVTVREGRETVVKLRFLPVLALLGAEPDVAPALARLRGYNVLDASDSSGADPDAILAKGGAVSASARDLVVAGTDAALLAWTEVRPARGPARASRELVLLASGSRRADRLPAATEEELRRSVEALDAPMALESPSLGLVTVDVRFLAHPLVAALGEGGAAQRAGVRVGDEVLSVAGRAVDGIAALDAETGGLEPGREVVVGLRRATGELEARIRAGRSAIDPDFRGGSPPPNAALARLSVPVPSGLAETDDAPVVALARGKAWMALEDWEQAYASFSDADLGSAEGVGQGTLLYYRGLAAWRSGRPVEARESLRRALAFPSSRLLGPEGPPSLPLVRELLQTLGEPDAD